MGDLGSAVWAVTAVVGAIGALAILHFLAVSVRNEVYIHDLRVKVAQLRFEQLERLRQLGEARGQTQEAPRAQPQAAQVRRAA